MAATDARPIPRKNVAYRVYLPIHDADGDLVTGAAGLDSEVSKDGGAMADCTNEATEIGSSGMYYLDLTATEMDADAVVIVVKTSTSGAKTTPIVLYPEEAGDIRVDVVQISGDATAADNLESYTDGTTPMPVNATQISGDAVAADNLESYLDGSARMPVNVAQFGGSNLTSSGGIPSVNAAQISGDTTAADNLEAALDGTGGVTITAALTGNVTGNLSGSVGSIAAGGLTAASIGADAFTAAKFAADVTTEFQSGLATAAALATVAGYLDTEIADIKAKTDNLPSDPADASVVAGLIAAVEAKVDSVQSDTNDIQTRLPAALVGGRMSSDLGSISGSTAAADAAEEGFKGLVASTCAAGSTTTSIVTNLTEATSDHYNGGVLVFTSGNLAGQRTSISDYDGTTKTLTVVALTEAPANGDAFFIN
jgi:hypothetical protein